jgi:hypothetical protein
MYLALDQLEVQRKLGHEAVSWGVEDPPDPGAIFALPRARSLVHGPVILQTDNTIIICTAVSVDNSTWCSDTNPAAPPVKEITPIQWAMNTSTTEWLENRTCRSDTNPVAPSHICEVSNISSSGGTIDRALAHLSDCEHCSWFSALDSKADFGLPLIYAYSKGDFGVPLIYAQPGR